MKRVGGIFDRILERDNLELAFYKACRGKRAHSDCRHYAAHLDEELKMLHDGLADGTYRVGNYHRFWIQEPKEREICAAPFAERVLHHALMNVCEPYFEKWLVENTFACRRNMGQLKAVKVAVDCSQQRSPLAGHPPSGTSLREGEANILRLCGTGSAKVSRERYMQAFF